MATDIPSATVDYVLERDDYRCQVCGRRGRVEIHHVRPRSRAFGVEDIHDANNLCCLCPEHHSMVTRGVLLVDRFEVYPGVWSVFFEDAK